MIRLDLAKRFIGLPARNENYEVRRRLVLAASSQAEPWAATWTSGSWLTISGSEGPAVATLQRSRRQ